MEHAASDEQITAICRLMYNNFQVKAQFVNAQLELLSGSGGDAQAANPLYSTLRESLVQLNIEAAELNYPLIQSLNELENYVIVRIEREKMRVGYVIFGPSAYSDISVEAITGILNDYRRAGQPEGSSA